MNKMAKIDLFGNGYDKAMSIFGEDHKFSKIDMVCGVWVARFLCRPDSYAQKNGAWKTQVGYAAIGKNGKVVSDGSRKDTIKMAMTAGDNEWNG